MENKVGDSDAVQNSENEKGAQLASRRHFLKILGVGAGAMAGLGFPSILKAQSKNAIKIGV
ncbi:MAG TPA: twin-arginine translocation signal domain-containing protein, partial [Candidatus Binatia bacterium]|nr:twin-arginine translocation signal domain-containing protein [Candidatus Binatia bacterium]